MADYQVTGNEGSQITSTQAQEWINRYVATIGPSGIRSYLYGINKINDLMRLNGSNVRGIRIAYSLDPNNVPRLILYAVNSENVILTAYILEDGLPCPPFCSKP